MSTSLNKTDTPRTCYLSAAADLATQTGQLAAGSRGVLQLCAGRDWVPAHESHVNFIRQSHCMLGHGWVPAHSKRHVLVR